MLQFILGRASSGKTYTVIEKISECIERGKSPVLLVPEQFSFESEKNILDRVGDGNAQKVTVISFTRLCDEVERINGGVCGTTVSDTDKIILMKRAITACRDSLKRFKKYNNSSSFARLMVETVGEFKLNFITADDLYSAAESIDDEQLKVKLLDTALIYENYDAVLAEKFIDGTDRLTKLYYALQNCKYFENKTVFIDSFKGFSGQQYKILERIISQASAVTVTLTDNPLDNREFGLFSNVKKVKNRIESIARKFAVDIAEDIVLNQKHYSNEELSALESFMAEGKADIDTECKNITICHADSVYGEADFVARNIRRIVREQGAHYSDFVVIARDTAPYEDALEVACKKNNIACFIDRRLPLSSMPPATALVSAVRLAQNFTTENILRFHKSGIDVLTFDNITTLENYAYLWNIDGSGWLKEWDMNPDGFNADENGADKNSAELEKINNLRKKAVTPIEKFKNAFYGTAGNMARALVELFEDCGYKEKFLKLSKQYSDDKIYADAMRQSWDMLMQILNSLTVCFGEAQISKNEFCDALNTAVSTETVGVIPQMIDEVTFGAADRIRPSRPKYAFIVGANQGVFPQTQQSTGLFAGTERQKLILLGLEIPDKTFSMSIDEECLLYSNVCCASDAVFISYTDTFDGTTLAEPSAFVGDIQKTFKCKTVNEPSALSDSFLPETAEDAFSLLCGQLSCEGDDTSTLELALEDSAMSERVNSAINSRERTVHSISSETSKLLFGEKIVMSPSKFDTFNHCRFMYFCRYGLRAQSIQPAEFNAMQRGTLVHYVLQKAVEDYGKSLADLNEMQISDIVDNYTEQYLDLIAGYRSIETPHLKFLVSTMKRTLKEVVSRLAKEFAQSDFTPVKCELKIGYDGDIPEIKIPIDDYGELELTGIVDRLDKWNGYVRIIDYKTGSRNFKLPDILFGQNMQMLIYLYAVTKSEQFGGKSAGILYMPASRAKDGAPTKRRMNGLLSGEMSVVTAMDKENKGEFVPKFSESSPSDSYVSPQDFDKIFNFIEEKLKSSGRAIYSGNISADPIDGLDKGACDYCEYASVCRIGNEKHKTVPRLTNQEVISEIERQENDNGI